jgi:hypothetical protein
MRHTFYANNRNSIVSRGSEKMFFSNNRNNSGKFFGSSTQSKSVTKRSGNPIADKVSDLLDLYAQDEEIKDEIIGKLSMYRANVTIARQFNNPKREKTLKKEFLNYLDQKLNERKR